MNDSTVDTKVDDFLFVFDRKNTVSYGLFYNVLDRKNTLTLFGGLKFGKSLFSKLYNKYLFRWKRTGVRRKKIRNKIVVMTNESLNGISDRVLLRIKKYAKAVVLFFIDEQFNDYAGIRRAKELAQKRNGLFDLVYTFSPRDARESDMLLNLAYYSAYPFEENDDVADVFFVGSLKNRGDVLAKTYDYLESNGVGCLFYVSTERKNRTNANFRYQTISYRESVERLAGCNVIFDVADERQKGMTLRYFEAVVYGKKLLTNNERVVDMPYYDERYMKLYKSVEDIAKIDPAWFREREKIDYGYRGEFEPIHFLESIRGELREKA